MPAIGLSPTAMPRVTRQAIVIPIEPRRAVRRTSRNVLGRPIARAGDRVAGCGVCLGHSADIGHAASSRANKAPEKTNLSKWALLTYLSDTNTPNLTRYYFYISSTTHSFLKNR